MIKFTAEIAKYAEWPGPQPQFGKENRIGRFPKESRPKG